VSRILVADDDPSVRELCQIILATEGYEVLLAEDAAQAIALAREHHPDLILLDWMMPGVDGMDALLILKGDAATADIPVVMLTALDGMPQITLATYNGADSYVTKPFEVADLLSLVRRFTQEPMSAR